MKQLLLKEIQQIELNLLLEFDKICKYYNLCYTLAGGTLLGAIRHHGFIPWDNDIDVCLPRNDYNKFIQVMENNRDHLYLKCCSLKTGEAVFPFTKFFDIRTSIQENPYEQGLGNKHIWIDVFPIDGLPNDHKKIKKIYSKCSRYRKNMVFSMASNSNLASNPIASIVKRMAKPICKKYNEYYWAKKIEDLSVQYKIEDCYYIGDIVWGLYGTGEKMIKSEFFDIVNVEFEKHFFPAPGCWDSYLTGLYGNYMSLPPEEKRISHTIEAYWIGDETELKKMVKCIHDR